jgi:hypothetical protein
MKLSELRKYAALVGTTIDCRHHLLSPDGAAKLVADIDEAIQRARQEGEKHATEKCDSAHAYHPPSQREQTHAAMDAKMHEAYKQAKQERGWGAPATEERQALTARLRALEESAKWMDAFRQSHSKRLQALENSLGTMAARVMPAGSSSSNTSLPDMLKRVQALDRIGEIQFRKATEI